MATPIFETSPAELIGGYKSTTTPFERDRRSKDQSKKAAFLNQYFGNYPDRSWFGGLQLQGFLIKKI